jgi:putative colanic acid biosynthesis acetyltransferase WcaF
VTAATDPSTPPPPAADRHQSPWTAREKLGRLAWYAVQATLFRPSPHNFYRWRAWLLRRFGARLGHNVRVRRTVRVEVPWHLTIGDGTSVGDLAILYSLGPITIGRNVTIS